MTGTGRHINDVPAPTRGGRELDDERLASGVAEAGPPPPIELADRWSAVLVTPGSRALDLVHEWMNADHVAPFWKQDWAHDRWGAEIARQLAGSHSRPYVVELDGAPLAYIEVYRAGRDVVAEHYPGHPHDLGLHIAIGDRGRTGRGLGRATVDVVVQAAFAADPECRTIVGDPAVGHPVIGRTLEAVGFRLHAEVDLPHKRAVLFLRHRDGSGVVSGS